MAFQISPITSFDFRIAFDTAQFAIVGFDSVNAQLAPALAINPMTRVVLFSEPNAVDLTFNDCERLFQVCLRVIGDTAVTSPIGIDPARSSEFARLSGAFPVTNVSGTISIVVDSSFCSGFSGPTVGITREQGRSWRHRLRERGWF